MTTSTQLVDTIVGMNLSASMFCLIVAVILLICCIFCNRVYSGPQYIFYSLMPGK